jgi:hypothetical protein
MPRPLANSSALFESQLLSPQSIFTANKNLQFTSPLNIHVVTTIKTFLLFSHSARLETDLSPCKGHIYKNRVHFIRMQENVTTLTTEFIPFWRYAIPLFHNALVMNININQWNSMSKIGTTTRPRRSLWVSWKTIVFKFKVFKSVHHRAIQINHQPDATIFQFTILTFI